MQVILIENVNIIIDCFNSFGVIHSLHKLPLKSDLSLKDAQKNIWMLKLAN